MKVEKDHIFLIVLSLSAYTQGLDTLVVIKRVTLANVPENRSKSNETLLNWCNEQLFITKNDVLLARTAIIASSPPSEVIMNPFLVYSLHYSAATSASTTLIHHHKATTFVPPLWQMLPAFMWLQSLNQHSIYPLPQ